LDKEFNELKSNIIKLKNKSAKKGDIETINQQIRNIEMDIEQIQLTKSVCSTSDKSVSGSDKLESNN
jgi:hypothetical protein